MTNNKSCYLLEAFGPRVCKLSIVSADKEYVFFFFFNHHVEILQLLCNQRYFPLHTFFLYQHSKYSSVSCWVCCLLKIMLVWAFCHICQLYWHGALFYVLQPDSETQLLTVQFEWNGVLKSVSSTLIGVSPEFELAIYTLCFFVGGEDNHVQLGPYPVNIKCYRHGNRLGSAFPIADS